MTFYVNIPGYFTKIHGVDDEIYWYLRDISHFFMDKTYSEIIDTIGLMPIIVPKDDPMKERVQFDFGSKLAIVSKKVDYDLYLYSDTTIRKKLLVKNILASIKSIKRKGKFDYERFEKDMLEFAEFTKKEVM